MTAARRTVATWCTAVIVAAAAYATGGMIGDAARSATAVDTTTGAPVFTIPAAPVAPCVPFVITDATDPADVGDMMAAGWTSDPTDHAEAIYPPGCRTR